MVLSVESGWKVEWVWLKLFSEDLGWEAGVGWKETEGMREGKEFGENWAANYSCFCACVCSPGERTSLWLFQCSSDFYNWYWVWGLYLLVESCNCANELVFPWETFAEGGQKTIVPQSLVFSTVYRVGVDAEVFTWTCAVSSTVLNLGQFYPLGDIWQCLVIPLVLTTAGCEGAPGISWIKARDAAVPYNKELSASKSP